jgi:hypothetical protein
MFARRIITALAVALVATACTDKTPVAVTDQSVAPEAASLSQHQTSGLLTDIPVTGTLEDNTLFEGLLNITELGFVDGDLVATGTVTDLAGDVLGTFTDAVIELTRADGPGGSCRILFLDIPGGVFLDVLGLVVDLDQVTLEIRAERGAGNLLGNLLCALVGLLDGPAALWAILNLIGQINDLLG